MTAHRGRREAHVDASPQECLDALTDVPRLHEWQRALRRARVVAREPDGDVVEFEVDAKVRTLRYRLRVTPQPPGLLDSVYVSGPFRDLSARWTFEPAPKGGTLAAVEVTVDPGRWVPAPVVRLVEDALLGRAVSDLQRRFTAA